MLPQFRGLEIGGERTPAYPDYDQVDNIPDFGANFICDALHLDIIDDDIYDHVYARNVLEHISWHHTDVAIDNWLRVTKPGGQLEIIVPDVLGIIEHYRKGIDPWEHTCERIAGTQDYPGNTHLAFFTFDEFEAHIPKGKEAVIEDSHGGAGITAVIFK